MTMKQCTYDAISKDSVSSSESLSVMMYNERTAYQCRDYLNIVPPSNQQHQHDDAAIIITETDRTRIVDWCYSVVDQCKFDRETVAIAMNMVDRYLSATATATSMPATRPTSSSSSSNNNIININPLQNRKSYQLLTMSALYSSIKQHERIALSSSFFAAMSRGTYTVQDIENMELMIYNVLRWRVGGVPTSIGMAQYILSLMLHPPHHHLQLQVEQQEEDGTNVVINEATLGLLLDEIRFQTESAVRDYQSFVLQRPSSIAIAAIFNALSTQGVVVNVQERSALLRALLNVIKSYDETDDNNDGKEDLNNKNKMLMFDPLEDLLAVRKRLKCFVDGDVYATTSTITTDSSTATTRPQEEEGGPYDDDDANTIVSASSREVAEANASNGSSSSNNRTTRASSRANKRGSEDLLTAVQEQAQGNEEEEEDPSHHLGPSPRKRRASVEREASPRTVSPMITDGI